MGLPFASGHVLALRRFPSSSIGPAYTAIWHRSPQGSWTIWSTIEPTKACARYFGRELEHAIQAPIELSWPDSFRIAVKIDAGRTLDWQVDLGSTIVTRSLSAVARTIPTGLWGRRPVRAMMEAVAGPMLGAGRLSLDGIAPNGQWFEANPKLIWFVTGGSATLNGADLGPPGALDRQGALGDFLIPQRGIFAFGQSIFEPFAEDRHLAATTGGSTTDP
jgi:hypothetical protein